jgi:hypothetical protein
MRRLPEGAASRGAHPRPLETVAGPTRAAVTRAPQARANKAKYPELDVHRVPGVSDAKNPDNVLTASKSLDAGVRSKLKAAALAAPAAFGAKSMAEVDGDLSFTVSLMRKGKIDPAATCSSDAGAAPARASPTMLIPTTTRAKIYAGFGCATALLLLVGAVAWLGASGLVAQLRAMSADRLPGVMALAQCAEGQLAVNDGVKAALLRRIGEEGRAAALEQVVAKLAGSRTARRSSRRATRRRRSWRCGRGGRTSSPSGARRSPRSGGARLRHGARPGVDDPRPPRRVRPGCARRWPPGTSTRAAIPRRSSASSRRSSSA